MPPLTKSRLVIPEDFCKVTVHMTTPHSLHPASWGFGIETDDVSAVCDAVGDALVDPADSFQDRLYAGYTIDRVTARSNSETAEKPLSLPGLGVNADLVTPAVAARGKLSTTTAGRRGSGRWYWPGVLAESDVQNSGEIDSLAVASITDVANDFRDNLATQLPTLRVFLLHSYSWPYDDPDPGEPVGFPAPSLVTASACQVFVATQRRRQR
jgi:hypothetical protein